MNARQLVMYHKRKQLAAARPRNKLRRPPVWLHPMALEREYAQELLKYVNFMEETARAILFPALPGLVAEAAQDNPVHADGYAESLEQMIRAMSLQIDKQSPYNWNTQTMDIGQKTSKWNSAQWQKTIKQVMGVNAAQYEPWIQDQLNSFSKENVALITSLKDKSLTTIEANAQRAIRTGKRHEEIAQEIQDEFGANRSRAKLIARDQVSKLNGQLTQMRQKDVGIKEYIWRTSGDERVRASHAMMDGKKCRWDDVTVYWNGTEWVKRTGSMYSGHPGSDYQCRCWAEPVFDSVYESIDNPFPAPEKRVVKPKPQDNTNLTENEKEAVRYYSFKGSVRINSILRGLVSNPPKTELKRIEQISSAINKSDLSTNQLTVYRGFDAGFIQNTLKVGDEIIEPSFMSVTKYEKIANGFAINAIEQPVVLRLKLDKNIKALDVQNFSAAKGHGVDEGELLIQKGTKYKIDKIAKTTIDGKGIIVVHASTM